MGWDAESVNADGREDADEEAPPLPGDPDTEPHSTEPEREASAAAAGAALPQQAGPPAAGSAMATGQEAADYATALTLAAMLTEPFDELCMKLADDVFGQVRQACTVKSNADKCSCNCLHDV